MPNKRKRPVMPPLSHIEVSEGKAKSLELSVWPESQTQSSGNIVIKLVEPSDDEECIITVEKMKDYFLEDFPNVTVSKDHPEFKKAVLPCGHAFCGMALVKHFLTTNMKCPVCRGGLDGKMNNACIPTHFRTKMVAKINESTRMELEAITASDNQMAREMFLQQLVSDTSSFLESHVYKLIIYTYSDRSTNRSILPMELPLQIVPLSLRSDSMSFEVSPSSLRDHARNLRALHMDTDIMSFSLCTRNIDGSVVELDRTMIIELGDLHPLVRRVYPGLTPGVSFEMSMLDGMEKASLGSIKCTVSQHALLHLLTQSA